MAGAGGFEPPYGGIKNRSFLSNINDLRSRIAATLHFGIKALRAFCQPF